MERHWGRWRRALERLDTREVRDRLRAPEAGWSADSEVTGVVAEAPHPPRAFVEAWYRDALARGRRSRSIRRGVLAAVILVVAAVALAVALALVGH